MVEMSDYDRGLAGKGTWCYRCGKYFQPTGYDPAIFAVGLRRVYHIGCYVEKLKVQKEKRKKKHG